MNDKPNDHRKIITYYGKTTKRILPSYIEITMLRNRYTNTSVFKMHINKNVDTILYFYNY